MKRSGSDLPGKYATTLEKSESTSYSKHKKPVKSSKEIFRCPKEGCVFETELKENLSSHLKNHKQCDICGTIFFGRNSARSFERHLKKHQYSQKEPEDLSCHDCGKVYTSKSILQGHKRKNCQGHLLWYMLSTEEKNSIKSVQL